jgi:enoyl-CoA hydratase/carnithine racemase
MAYEEVQYEVANHIAVVTLNRPARLNAWTMKMEQEVSSIMGEAEKDDAVRVIVVTGSGRGFCAGADMELLGTAMAAPGGFDLSKLTAPGGPHAGESGALPDFQTKYGYFPSITKPIIAAINGPAAGLGLVLALYCDLRFGSDQAKFSTAFARRGLIAEHGSNWILPRLIGPANALDLLMTARTINAEEARQMGLISQVLPHEGFLAKVMEFASDMATNVSPRSMRVIKQQVYRAMSQSLAEAYNSSNEEMVQSFFSEDFREGVAHYLEKRPPRFTGK